VLQRADGTPLPPPQSFGQLVALSHDLAHTPSPHLAQAPAVVQPTSETPGSPNETEPKAMATAAAAINNILRKFIYPSSFAAWVRVVNARRTNPAGAGFPSPLQVECAKTRSGLSATVR
jgi:hypothetical protein